MKTLDYKFIAKRLALYSLITVGVIFAVALLLLLGIPKLQSQDIRAENAVVLGAAINTPTIKQRALKGLELYEQGRVERLVFSGGKIADSDISEAGYMARFVQTRASSAVTFLIEDQSRNTYENLKNTASLVDKSQPLVVVSDEFHLARAVIMAKRLGFATVYWSAPNQNYYSRNELRFYYVREFFGLLRYLPKFIFG